MTKTIELSDQAAESLTKLLLRFLYKDDISLSMMDAINLNPVYQQVSGEPMRKLQANIHLFKAEKPEEDEQ